MTRHLTTLLLVAGCWIHAALSAPSGPVLTITAPAHVMISDSTNLVDWQDVAETQDLTLLIPAGCGFLRGRVTETTLTLSFDRNPAVAGTFIYLGSSPGTYFQRFDAHANTNLTLTILNPSPDLYFNGTSYTTNDIESDFGGEIHRSVPAPLLTVTVSR